MKTLIRDPRRWLLALLFALAAQATTAAEISDARALRGVETGKAVFLLDMANPARIALYLEIIAGTHRRLVERNVAPDFVVVFIGPTVQFLAARPAEGLMLEYPEQIERIREAVAALDRLDVRMEVCAIACDVFGVEPDNLLPQLKLISDGFISLIGYQEQGYHLVPIF